MIGQEERLRRLVESGIALTSHLSLDELLQNIVESAAMLTGARYAALGVIDERGSALERFITHGIDTDTRRNIGDLPVGRGILGVLIRDAKPLRLHDLGQDPRSVGFPPGHPPMRTFLGVPITLRGASYGNLYLTEKDGGEDFTAGDEDLATLLASQAAVAIENARLFATSRQWIRQLESLAEIGNALAGEIEVSRLLQLVVERVREVVACRLVLLFVPDREGALRVEASAGEDTADVASLVLPVAESKVGRVMQRKRSARIDSVMDDPEFLRWSLQALDPRAALLVPLLAADEAIGVLALYDKGAPGGRFGDSDVRLAEMFAERAAVAMQLSQRVARDTLQSLVRGQELERRRFARELHDETGQALTAILLGLRNVSGAESDDERERALEHLRELAVAALDDVRRLAVEIRPRALDDFGLTAALERLAETVVARSGMAIHVHVAVTDRLSDDIETAVYRMVQEAITNVIKHAQAKSVSVVVARSETSLRVIVEDDGVGMSPGALDGGRFGLAAMRERLALIDGQLEVDGRPGRGVTLSAVIPL